MASPTPPALTQESHKYYRMRPGREKETSARIIVSFPCLGRIANKNRFKLLSQLVFGRGMGNPLLTQRRVLHEYFRSIIVPA